jgi:hypothetical protein
VDTTDPVHSCTGQRDGHTVWYRFTPTRSGVATITTHGSNYDTVLSVYQASTLSEAPGACHDDIANNDLSSVLQVTMLAGVQYLIEVSAFGGSPGGDLALAVTFSTTASAHVIMELTQVRLGQTFTFGFLAQNPVGSPPADLYLGYLAPDLRTVVFYRELGPQTTAPYEMPALFSAHKAAPGGYAESKPGYLGIALPAGAQTGTYRFFAALVRQGAFVDNRIEPDDVLALDVKLVEVSP